MSKLKTITLAPALVLAAFLIAIAGAFSPKVFSQSELLNKPVDSQKTSSISERLASRKKEIKLDLSASAAENIEAKCTGAQAKIGELKAGSTAAIDNYYKTYGDIAGRVSGLIGRLNQQGVPTAGIQTALNQYIDAANQFLVDADKYSAALADLETMDCPADAEGFAVTLQEARKLRASLATDTESAKNKIDAISAALIAAKDKL